MAAERDVELLKKALGRERERRRKAEQILETKSRELYEASEALREAMRDLRRNQRQLVQSEKMASLGIMSAGIAHEINNPIGFVLSNVNTLAEYTKVFYRGYELIREKLAETEGASEVARVLDDYARDEDLDYLIEDTSSLLKETDDGLARVRDIVDGLRDFARADDARMQAIDLNEVVESALTMAQSQLKYRCDVQRSLGSLPSIQGNAGRLGQVVLNLLVNAAQATCDDCRIEVSTYTDADHAVVEVKDNGCGMTREQMAKLFTPFFTTKPVGEGTGLGLSVSHGIVAEHGGEIKVDSLIDVGTRFSVHLPLNGRGEAVP